MDVDANESTNRGGKRFLLERLRRNPRRRCTLNSLMNTGKENDPKLIQQEEEDEQQQQQQQHDAKQQINTRKKKMVVEDQENIAAVANSNVCSIPMTPEAKEGKKGSPLRSTQSLTPQEEVKDDISVDDGNDSEDLGSVASPSSSNWLKKKLFRTSSSRSLGSSSKKRKLEKQIEELKAKLESMELGKKQMESEIGQLRKDKTVLEATTQAQIVARTTMETHTGWLQRQVAHSGHLQEMLQMASEDKLSTELRAETLRSETAFWREAFQRSEVVRRNLHEQKMLQRGNMRVYCRLKPVACEKLQDFTPFQLLDGSEGDMKQKLRVKAEKELSVDGLSETQKSWDFTFDRVFHEEDSQDAVFREVEGLVQSTIDGFNACIFAYGQTGSGKTHTMLGDQENPGISKRALDMLMSACEDRGFQIELSFLEIYNETLRDLLNPEAEDQTTNLQSSGRRKNKKPKLRIIPTSLQIEGLSKVKLVNRHQAQKLIEKAQSIRAVAKTNINERSSRSHSVITLYISQPNHEEPSMLHLVDLAGSERLAQSGSGGNPQTLKEQCAINTSLVALKNTLRALSMKQIHVPYRDSKLTYLLQNSLQKHSAKTLMICTISQNSGHLSESLNSLRFAENVLMMKDSHLSMETERKQHPTTTSTSNTRPSVSSRNPRRRKSTFGW